MHDSVTVHMSASPEVVWGLLSDVTRIGELSPETFEAEWVGDATGPAVGARFRGHVKRNGRGPTYWTTCRVSECEPGKVFAFAVHSPARVFKGDGDMVGKRMHFSVTRTRTKNGVSLGALHAE